MNLSIDRETWITEQVEKPFTGYFIVSDETMQGEGFTDFLFDNFKLVADITTPEDEYHNHVRLLMRSPVFNRGFGHYNMDVERGADNYRRIVTLKFVTPCQK